MEDILYKLKKTKITFKYYQSIDAELYQPTFNNPKFNLISHLVQDILNDGSMVKYDIAHNKAVHKYLLIVFYNKTNKKEYYS